MASRDVSGWAAGCTDECSRASQVISWLCWIYLCRWEWILIHPLIELHLLHLLHCKLHSSSSLQLCHRSTFSILLQVSANSWLSRNLEMSVHPRLSARPCIWVRSFHHPPSPPRGVFCCCLIWEVMKNFPWKAQCLWRESQVRHSTQYN